MNWLMNNLNLLIFGFIILSSVLGPVLKKLKDKQDERRAREAMQRQRLESIRTGQVETFTTTSSSDTAPTEQRRASEPEDFQERLRREIASRTGQPGHSGPVSVSTASSAPPAAARGPKPLTAAEIAARRAEAARRARQSGQSPPAAPPRPGATPSPSSPMRGRAPSAPRPTRVPTARTQRTTTARPARTATVRTTRATTARGMPTSTEGAPAPTLPVTAPNAGPFAREPIAADAFEANSIESTAIGTATGAASRRGPRKGLAAQLAFDIDSIRRAVVYNEILGKPKALQDRE